MKQSIISTILSLFSIIGGTSAFAPSLPSNVAGVLVSSRNIGSSSSSSIIAAPNSNIINNSNTMLPVSLQRQRKSMANVQTMGLFGLGAPEVGIILVAAAFLLGPDKLASMGKDAGKIAGELKEVPKEFQAGMAEGEASAKAMKASEMSNVDEQQEAAKVVEVEKDAKE